MSGREPPAGTSSSDGASSAAAFVPSARWGGAGHVVDLGGPVHWVDFGGPDQIDRPPVVLVHGLGGSHLNWVTVAPALARQSRVFAIDLAGFGLTPTAGRSASVQANTQLLDRFLRRVVARPAVLVGNSMGGMISMLQTDAQPDTVAGLVLVDPSVPQTLRMLDRQVALGFAVMALPIVGARLSRRIRNRTPARVAVQQVVNLCFADPGRMPPEVFEAGVALAEYRARLPDEEAAFIVAARSLLRVVQDRNGYEALMRRITVPVLLVHGSHDRLVARAAADAVAANNPHWSYTVFDGAGHTPQLEVPELFLAETLGWLDRSVLPVRPTDGDPTRTPDGRN
ncbi:MAG TPA: alpha/beta hydrolase [Kineosporiaceae bacterium]|nr:alpha/beta hydrolase [Kineosporiaceae bacterium]